MKKMFLVFGITIALVFAGCASSSGSTSGSGQSTATVPPEISDWMNKNSATMVSGMGISTLSDASLAYQQASTLGIQDLASKLETRVAGIRENYAQVSTVGGESDTASQFSTSTKQLTNRTVESAKSYGPFMNNKGDTYLIIYLDPEATKAFDTSVHQVADQIFAPKKQELDNMLQNQ